MKSKNRIYFKLGNKEIYSRPITPENALKTAATLGIIWIAVVVATLVGWVINIVELVAMPFDPITIEMIVRIVGVVFVPLGALMGYFF